MNKINVLILLFIIQFNFLKAGGWTCFRCKIEIVTESSTIIGFVQFGDTYRNYLSKDINNYINDFFKYPHDTITIYDTIYSLEYPKFDLYKLTAIPSNDLIKVPVYVIKNIRILSLEPCQEWLTERDSKDYEYYYAWVGHTMPIMELELNEIQLLNSEPVAICSFHDPLSEFGGYWIISYSKSIDEIEIKKIFEEYKDRLLNYSGSLRKSEFYLIEYQNLKQMFRENNTIVFRISVVA